MRTGISNFGSFQSMVQQGNAMAINQTCRTAAGFGPQAERGVRLTPRELEVLTLLCEGLPNKLIGRRLDISSATVKCHISRILNELGVASRLQAVVAAARRGLVRESTVADSDDGLSSAGHASYGGPHGSVRAGPAIASL